MDSEELPENEVRLIWESITINFHTLSESIFSFGMTVRSFSSGVEAVFGRVGHSESRVPVWAKQLVELYERLDEITNEMRVLFETESIEFSKDNLENVMSRMEVLLSRINYAIEASGLLKTTLGLLNNLFPAEVHILQFRKIWTNYNDENLLHVSGNEFQTNLALTLTLPSQIQDSINSLIEKIDLADFSISSFSDFIPDLFGNDD